jgi:hypothetical protein
VRRIDQFRARRGSATKRSAQALETLGLILIVVLILAITITRSWHHINWSTR